MPNPVRSVALAATLVAAGLPAQSAPVPHDLGPVLARATDTIGSVLQLVQLAGGRVLVNDNARQRLVIFDASLGHPTVILDTSSTAKRRYPQGRGGTPLRYRDDSIMFADPTTPTFLIMDANGVIVRDAAFPSGARPLVGSGAPVGTRSDSLGRIVYWSQASGPCGDPSTMDSVPLMRADLSARGVDTVGWVRHMRRPCPPSKTLPPGVPRPPNAGAGVVPGITRRDEWALLRDGTVAIVRERDYSIDWIDPDGTHRHTPQVMRDWHRLTDDEKTAIMDSVKAFYRAAADSVLKSVLSDPRFASLADNVKANVNLESMMPEFLSPDDLPDYLHAFQNPIRADDDGNLWVPEAVNQLVPKTLDSTGPGTPDVFDIVNRQGVLVDRVRIPTGSRVVGLGSGVVYLSSSVGEGSVSLVKVRVR